MTQHQTSRTLVKSTPELWAECSDAASLARHLGAFGEIRITKLEPETAVAWEGAAARGTVKLEPSGWGTRVTLTLTEEATPEVVAVVEPPPVAESPVALEPAAASEPTVALEPAAADESTDASDPAPARDSRAEEPSASSGLFARFLVRLRGPRPEVPPAPEALEPVAPQREAPQPEAPQQEAPQPVAAEPPEPEAPQPEAPQPEPAADGSPQGEAALTAALDSLGRAHHRPYSRA